MKDFPSFESVSVGKSFPFGMFWRFLVMGDPTVNHFLVRDTDSLILPREVDAVQEWIQSPMQFHVMRDSPTHNTAIVAGLFGGRNYDNLSALITLNE